MSNYVIVGLGNPGREYTLTRHNIGYLIVQALARTLEWNFKVEKQFNAEVAKGKVKEETLHLVLPLTYMNESGYAARRYLDYYKLGPKDLIIVTDDVALPFGHLRIRTTGSDGGHNGLKSIQEHLHTQHYTRLRVGIGQKLAGQDLKEYVLDPFSKKELSQLPLLVDQGASILIRMVLEGIAPVMNSVNKKVGTEGTEE